MKLSFSKKERIIVGTVVLVLILYLIFLQFYILSPLKSDLQTKQVQLQSEQKLVETMQKKSGNNQTADANTTELQKEIPVKPLQDQLILDLQQAEAVSNSLIKSMSFTEGGQTAVASTQPAATTASTQNQSNPGTTSQANSSTSTAAAQQQNSQPASNTTQQTTQTANTAQTAGTPAVNKLTVQLSIQSQKYVDLEKFINTLESLKRITVVEAINYTGNKEITSLNQDNKQLDYTLTISAYYLPGLTDLDKQLPKVDFPAPANKENPLSQFADTQTQ